MVMYRDDHALEITAACLMSEGDDGGARAIPKGRGSVVVTEMPGSGKLRCETNCGKVDYRR
jgi:hypothetical protein